MNSWTTIGILRRSIFSLATSIALLVVLIILVNGRSTLAQGTVRYATTTGMTTGLCTSWTIACTLDYAMSQTVAGDETWVAAGTYTPTVGIGPTASFTLTNGVAIYGGFAGTENSRGQRNWTTNVVVLDGDAGNAGDDTDNSNHVVSAVNVDATTLVDGLTIRGGRATGYGATGNGAGIYVSNGRLTIANTIFISNTASQYGGGLYSRDGAPTLINVQFVGNSAAYGGGVANSRTTMSLTDVTFRDNVGNFFGGGLHNSYSATVLTNVRFEKNTAGSFGGALYSSNSTPTLTNVRFEGNSSQSYGGAVYSSNSTSSITASQFVSNVASFHGGAIYLSKNGISMTDTVFFDNASKFSGGGIYMTNAFLQGHRTSMLGNTARYDGGAVFAVRSAVTMTHVAAAYNTAKYGGVFYNDTTRAVITNATMYSNSVTVDGGAIFNDGSPTTLVHLTAVGNAAGHYGGAIYSILDAPQARNAIFWGNTAEKGGAIIGMASFVNAIVEGGCPIGVSCVDVDDRDPLLGAPGNHGGFVNTIPILTGSPAIDRVTESCPATDARSVARPQGAACDVGAYETRGLVLAVVSGNNQSIEVYQPYPAPLVVSATSVEGHAVDGATVTFSSPASGPGTAPTSQIRTFAGGLASVNVTANSLPGDYRVTASAPGSQPVYFNLDNIDTPVAGLQASHSGASPVGHAVVFTASVQGGTNIDFDWDFGDGSTETTTKATLTHAYAVAGSYVVTVTASNEVASAHQSLLLTIYDVELAGLAATSNGPTALGQPTQFQATAQAGSGLTYVWSFGNGSSGVGQSPAHTYAVPGVYTATVSASNGTSSASAQTAVLVEQPLSDVKLLPHGTVVGEVGRAVTFSVEVGAGQPTNVTWRFGDEPIQGYSVIAAAEGNDPWTSIEHVYALPGAYQVAAHVANSVSQFDVINVAEIRDVPISGASIVWNGAPEVQQALDFSAQHLEGTSVNCIWDFDDSTPPVTGCDIEHTYRKEGQYTVKLWMVNSVGVVVTRTTLSIVDPTPNPPQLRSLYLPVVASFTNAPQHRATYLPVVAR